MKEFLKKLQKIERTISSKKGMFSLFGLFLREDSPDKWDLVVAAPWIEKNKQHGIAHLARVLQEKLAPNEMIQLSRIVPIDERNPALSAIHGAIHVEHGTAEFKNCNFFGLSIKHAFIITSKDTGARLKTV